MSDKPELPKAIIVIKISAFMPRPENPEIGDFVETDAFHVPIYAQAKPLSSIPDGVIKNVREILQGLCEMARRHVFSAPLPEAKKQSTLILNPDDGIKGLPSVDVFVNDGTGKAVEMPKIGLVNSQGVDFS